MDFTFIDKKACLLYNNINWKICDSGAISMDTAIFKTKSLCFNNMIRYPDIGIQTGKTTFIVGESGCGKSTLLKMLNGSTEPSSGEIFYKGKSVAVMDTVMLRREVLLVSQSAFLFDSTIEENFNTFYEYLERPCPSHEEMDGYIRLCNAEFSLGKNCGTMSGGEKQRVCLAIFLSTGPRVIMLDEPTSALDNKNSYELMEKVIQYCKDKDIDVVVVSHDRILSDTFAEEKIELCAGGITK